ncbi:unnamed protein product [Darwinula stevensoni]|uniref:Protein unc-79 homolog n=1 Tax=Darwinula stevensoni TaxID=69355 RepID=A0A7R9A724_9CRUS|nr:unnamed protein product [Darwinula stevensoni]CAG0891189.1 unnamed protein product [Darwinula stevensoni]
MCRKLLDLEMNPLGFDAEEMYHFLLLRFTRTPAPVQDQALSWIQILSKLDLGIPIHFLLKIFHNGVKALGPESTQEVSLRLIQQQGSAPLTPVTLPGSSGPQLGHLDENEIWLGCFLKMLDVLLKQMEILEVKHHQGLDTFPGPQVLSLLHLMHQIPWPGDHTCTEQAEREERRHHRLARKGPEDEVEDMTPQVMDCTLCFLTDIWYQLARDLLLYLIPQPIPEQNELLDDELVHSTTEALKPLSSEGGGEAVQKSSEMKPSDVVITLGEPSTYYSGIATVPLLPHIQTATVETVQEDIAPMIPQERAVTATARAITITDDDVATAKVEVASAIVVNENDEPVPVGSEESDHQSREQFWITSVGKFKFSLTELPCQLQLIYHMLIHLPDHHDADVVYHLLMSLKHLIIHADSLGMAAKEHRGFLIWTQENLTIHNMWQLCQTRYSHVAEVAVQVLLHCLALPGGSEVFHQILQHEFHSEDWHARYAAVESVVVLGWFMETSTVRSSGNIQSSLATAFCFLVASLSDPCYTVATRTSVYLDTFTDASLKLLCWCMEVQFDLVIMDRPMVLQTLYRLSTALPHRNILTWDFFLNRFDALFLEAQIQLERVGEVPFPRDLKNNQIGSKVLQRKLSRAQEALNIASSDSSSIRTLASSLGTKWPYKRTMSAPCAMMDRYASSIQDPKDRPYGRQASAPLMSKRKGSRFWPGQFLAGMGLPNNFTESKNEDMTEALVLHRSLELDETDRETLHLLIFLLMHFLAHKAEGLLREGKEIPKHQGMVIQHLTYFLGYLPSERSFITSPFRIRNSPIFQAFISNLPELLDNNMAFGGDLAPMILSVLVFVPSPQKTPSEKYPPNYSLWLLDPTSRYSWLLSALIFLYKYQYHAEPLSGQVQVIVRIVLNTVEGFFHRCRTIPHGYFSSASQPYMAFNTSETSLGALDFTFEMHTPPCTPRNFEQRATQGASGTGTISSMGPHRHLSRRMDSTYPDSGFTDPDVAEPELAVIPESPKSESSAEKESLTEEMEVIVAETKKPPVEYACISAVEVIEPQVFRVKPALVEPLIQVVEVKPVVIQPSSAGDKDSPLSNPSFSISSSSTTLKDDEDITLEEKEEEEDDKDEGGDTRYGRYGRVFDSHPRLNWKVKEGPSPSIAARITDRGKSRDPSTILGQLISSFPVPSQERLLPVGGQAQHGRPVALMAMQEESEEDSSSLSLLVGQDSVEDNFDEFDGKLGLCSPWKNERDLIDQALPQQERLLPIGTRQLSATATAIAAVTPIILQDSFESDGSVHIPGNSVSVAKQALRCILHQLYPNNIFLQIFQTFVTEKKRVQFFRTLSQALSDFTELSLASPLQSVLEHYSGKKTLSAGNLPTLLSNIAVYLESLPLELASTALTPLLPLFESLFRKILNILGSHHTLQPAISIIIAVLKIPGINTQKSILDPFSKVVCQALESGDIGYYTLIDVCHLCNRAFARPITATIDKSIKKVVEQWVYHQLGAMPIGGLDVALSDYNLFRPMNEDHIGHHFENDKDVKNVERDRLLLTRSVVLLLAQALRFKVTLPPSSFLILVQMVLSDAGGSFPPEVLVKIPSGMPEGSLPMGPFNTCAAECLRGHLTDLIDFVTDVHTISKIKSMVGSVQQSKEGRACPKAHDVDRDALGGILKSGLAQFLALEIMRGNTRENRAVTRLLPWLSHTPSLVQQGPREFVDCVAHIRLLSWILLGAIRGGPGKIQPLTLESSCHLADHIQVILAGFPEQAKASVIHMSSLFHAFILCQLWTLYVEQLGSTPTGGTGDRDLASNAAATLTDFWAKVTPALLQLISHSKVLSEMVNLHFLNLMESLQECRSLTLSKLLPLWTPVFYAHNAQVPGHLQVRLQGCQAWPMPEGTGTPQHLAEGIQHLQVKLAQIEMQSSAATQFYSSP